jgi:hypothetical protein
MICIVTALTDGTSHEGLELVALSVPSRAPHVADPALLESHSGCQKISDRLGKSSHPPPN